MKSIVFVFDSLRADHISHLGYNRKTTKNIDSLAANGVTFEEAFSQATWTGPSSGSIVASQYPLVHQTGFLYQQRDPPPTIARPFQQSDHVTGCISPMTALSRENYDGFDEHIDLFEDYDPTAVETPEVVIDKTLDFINNHYNEDFFLFVWTSGTHTPYITPEKYNPKFSANHGFERASIPALQSSSIEDRRNVIDHYDDAIRYSDAEFGRILDQLKKYDIYEKTSLVVTADHGEMFDEHYRLEHSHPRLRRMMKTVLPEKIRSNNQLLTRTGWVGHQGILPYDELIHVPLIIKLPENKHAGRRVTELAQTLDIGPTLHDYANLDQMDTTQGTSLRPAIDTGNIVNEYVYSSSPMLMGLPVYHSVRDKEYKYMKIKRKPTNRQTKAEFNKQRARYLLSGLLYASLPSELLFDVAHNETQNIASENPSAVEDFSHEFEKWYRFASDDMNPSMMSEKRLEQLEDLGYIE